MRSLITTLIISGLLFFATSAHAQRTVLNLETCSIDFWNNVKAVQDLAQGVPVAKVQSVNRDLLSKVIKEDGLARGYRWIHSIYALCVETTGIDVDHPGAAANDPYWRCADESAFRMVILIAIEKGQAEAELKASLPVEFRDMTSAMYEEVNKGALYAATQSAQAIRACIKRARAQMRYRFHLEENRCVYPCTQN